MGGFYLDLGIVGLGTGLPCPEQQQNKNRSQRCDLAHDLLRMG
jgi:hypothetical protein